MASSALAGVSAVGIATIGGARRTTLCNPATWKLGAENRSRELLNDGTPQTNASTLNRIHGIQAAAMFSVPIGSLGVSSMDGGSVLGSSFHLSFGCQTLSKAAVAAMEETEATTSTNHGPWRFEIKNCGIAKAKPAVSAAGQTPSIPRNPAIAQTTPQGMISEKNGSCRPTI